MAHEIGLEIGPRGGIAVDDACRTSDEDIYAVGECASIRGQVYGLVAPGYHMAQVVAHQLTGSDTLFTAADTATKLKLMGIDVASFGDALGATPGALEVTVNNPVDRTYAKLVVSDDARTLLGGVLVGDVFRYGSLRPLVGRSLPGDPVSMLFNPSNGYSAPLSIPGDAPVCACYAITKDTITTAIETHSLTDVPGIKACTKAGSGCGSASRC